MEARLSRFAAAVAGCLLALAGCASHGAPGGATPAPVPSSGGTVVPSGAAFNATDVMFLQMMIPHHGQGLRIVRLARTHDVRPEVRTLAAAIDVTQVSEVEQMVGWLRSWEQPMTADANAHAGHGGMPGTGAAEIDALDRKTGADFERAFLNMLIAHQDDAIQIARLETGEGGFPPARSLADRIEQSRKAQIRQLLGFLGE